ncbi:MAG: hypothetical protein ACRBDL_08830 [Alphaproteobacteria bacterium]
MKMDKPSFLDSGAMPSISFSGALTIIFCCALEGGLFLLFFSTYTSVLGLLDHTLLSELPIIGGVFMRVDQEANGSHVLSFLLSIFSIAVPLMIWAEILRQKIMEDPQDWFQHRQNQVIAFVALTILSLVITLECVSLYTLIARESAPGGFGIAEDQSAIMSFLSQNKAMGIGVSIVIAVINLAISWMTARAFHSLKSEV